MFPPGHYPSKLLGFYKIKTQAYAIIQTVNDKETSEGDSCLKIWQQEYQLVNEPGITKTKEDGVYVEPYIPIVEFEAIVDRIYVIEEYPGLIVKINSTADIPQIVMVKPKDYWKNYFT